MAVLDVEAEHVITHQVRLPDTRSGICHTTEVG
jgi:hypothetical protein